MSRCRSATTRSREVVLPQYCVFGIACRVDAEAPLSELHRRAARVVEKGAVVADDEHRAAVVGEPRFEPRDRIEVEMVRRLVE